MAAYKLTRFDCVLRTADGAAIPIDERNADYRDYLAWVAAGNTADPADPPPIRYGGEQRLESRVTTTGTTPAELFRATLATLTAYSALVHLVGVDNGNGAVRVIRATVVAKRLQNGALLVGTPAVLANHADTGATSWTIAASVAGNDFVITVTGASGRTVDWFCRLEVDSFAPGGLP